MAFFLPFRPGMHAFIPFVFQRISEPVGIIAPVGQHPLCLWQAAQHGSSPGVIANGASGEEHAGRAALRIGYLNPIERLWTVMHQCVTHNRHYPTQKQFADTNLRFFFGKLCLKSGKLSETKYQIASASLLMRILRVLR